MRHLSLSCVCLLLVAAAVPNALPAQTLTFAPPRQISSGTPTAANTSLSLTGDFNGNGNTDLVVHVLSSGAFSYKFLAGDGNGNFTSTGAFDVNLSATDFSAALVGDMNGDGKDDIITLDPGCPETVCSKNGTLQIHLSDGDGHFTTSYTASLPPGFAGVTGVIGDFNNDGRPDIAVLNYPLAQFFPAPKLVVFINQGDSSFTKTTYSLPAALAELNFVGKLVSGDFQGNGNQDLAFVGDIGTILHADLFTATGDGHGHFAPVKLTYTFDSGFALIPAYAADLTGDGRTDLLVGLFPKSTPPFDLRVPTLLAQPSGSFIWSSALYIPTFETQGFVLADMNGDGKPDIIFVGLAGNVLNQLPAFGGVYLGLGNGKFQTPHIPFPVTGSNTFVDPSVAAVPLKTGDLPSLIIDNSAPTLELLINATKP